jgi:heptosyltransferase-1
MNILLVRVSSLGDVLHNMPIVADIKRHFPDANIDWVVEEGYVSLVRLNPMVRNILPWGLRRWRKSLGKKETRAEIGAFFRQLREVQYDYVFDTQGLLKTGIIMGAARGRHKVGLANGSEGSGYEGISRIFHTRSIALDPRTHAVARGRLVVGAALGFSVDVPADFGLPEVPAGEPRPDWMGEAPYAVFSTARRAMPRNGRRPTGSSWARRWRRCRCCCPGVRTRKRRKPKRWPPASRMRGCCRNCRWPTPSCWRAGPPWRWAWTPA